MLKFLGGLNFAHLRGLKAAKAEDAAARAAENPEDECDDEEDMQADQEAAEAEAGSESQTADDEDGKKGKKGKAKKAKKKPADEGDNSDGEDDDDEDGEDEENGKKASSSELRKAYGRGQKQQRARTAAIFSSPAAANNIELAAKLACDEKYANLSSAAAIEILEKSGTSKGKGLSDRMQGKSPNLSPSSPREPDKAKAIEASWEAAAKDFMPAK